MFLTHWVGLGEEIGHISWGSYDVLSGFPLLYCLFNGSGEKKWKLFCC